MLVVKALIKYLNILMALFVLAWNEQSRSVYRSVGVGSRLIVCPCPSVSLQVNEVCAPGRQTALELECPPSGASQQLGERLLVHFYYALTHWPLDSVAVCCHMSNGQSPSIIHAN